MDSLVAGGDMHVTYIQSTADTLIAILQSKCDSAYSGNMPRISYARDLDLHVRMGKYFPAVFCCSKACLHLHVLHFHALVHRFHVRHFTRGPLPLDSDTVLS